MSRVAANTLFVTTPGAYLRMRELSLQVLVEGKVQLAVPMHHLRAIAVFGYGTVSTAVVERCAAANIAISFIGSRGRISARIDAPVSGNVLLRREQYRAADDDARSVAIARSCVAGKLNNERTLLLRASREEGVSGIQRLTLRTAAARVKERIVALPSAKTGDELRGQEGTATRAYFEGVRAMLQGSGLPMAMRNRRPPRDPTNAILSFVYSLLEQDCLSAATVAGLDPAVGFMHRDRPGRSGLALDLMEEFRPLIADRVVLAAIHRKQVGREDFEYGEGGGVYLNADGRKAAITAYRERCADEVRHPLLNETVAVGELPFVQARLLARHIRGELAAYPPCVLR